MSTQEAAKTSGEVERLTWDEICRRYPDVWVVVADTDWVNDTDFDFRSTEVISQHKRRKEASADIIRERDRDREVGCFKTGELIPRSIP